MGEKDKKKSFSEKGNAAAKTKEFTLDDFKINSISSAATVKIQGAAGETANAKDENAADALPKTSAEAPSNDENLRRMENPVFRELAEPTLPELQRENRARLQMQSPTRLHFYWSFKINPFETARRVFGANANDYTLVVKLVNETSKREEIFPVETEGSSWFDADADSSYRVETGFYNAHRPFVRLMFSNRVETPRKNPSPHLAAPADWATSADNFAEVLDYSGFSHDAFEVALAGDDFAFAETATKTAFAQMFGETENDVFNDNSSEMRFALLALAAGYAPENLRGQISHSLFLRLQTNAANLNAEKALAALEENFGVFADENTKIEFPAPTVFGASLVNFPRSSKRGFPLKFAPVSSFNFRANG